MSRGTEFIKTILKKVTSEGFARSIKDIEILSAGNGKCKAQFTVNEDHLNAGGSLHGGFISTLIDCISSYALITHEKNSTPGVSIDLHVTFLKAAFPGDVVVVDAQTVRAGNKLAFLTVELTKNGKDVIAHGGHTKYIARINA